MATFFIFAMFFLILFHKGIITGTFYSVGDQFVQVHPLRREGWKLIRGGTLPLWKPYSPIRNVFTDGDVSARETR